MGERGRSNAGVVAAARIVLQSLKAVCGVLDARRVAQKRTVACGGVEFAGGMSSSALLPAAVLWLPVVLFWSALTPLAVLSLPVVLLMNASLPENVLVRGSQPPGQVKTCARAAAGSARHTSMSTTLRKRGSKMQTSSGPVNDWDERYISFLFLWCIDWIPLMGSHFLPFSRTPQSNQRSR